MTEFLTLLLLLVGGAMLVVLHRRVDALRTELDSIRARLDRGVAGSPTADVPSTAMPRPAQPWAAGSDLARATPAPPADPAGAPAVSASPASAAPAAAPDDDLRVVVRSGRGTPPPAAPPADPDRSLETLIGTRLPVWIGGAALVLAGFFLVRYSIESGLLGPAARTVLAALFAVALVGASEAARRLPATRDDPRIGQALAGAGVASLYATLYMAAALYHLIPALLAFALMLAITALALGLALRHGPPTAIMALLGGFLAPLVAGYDAAGIAPLLVYLGLFIAALFGLAIHRGWAWLALTAAAAGFGWVNFLLVALPAEALGGLGVFVVLLAIGASAALPATRLPWPLLRLAPLVAGLVQLLALAPALDFGPLAWGLYLLLAAAALALAWRDAQFAAGGTSALALFLLLLAGGLLQGERGATPVAALLGTLLFALPGHVLARRGLLWALIALGGSAGPVLVAHLAAQALLPGWGWALAELATGAACAALAWRVAAWPMRVVASALAALLLALAGGDASGMHWLPLWLALAMAGLALWARRHHGDAGEARDLAALPGLFFAAGLLVAAAPLARFAWLIATSLIGSELTYPELPPLATALRVLAPPVLVAGALLWRLPDTFGPLRRSVAPVTIALALLLLYTLAKQVLFIVTPSAFVDWGFVERVLLTQACLVAGWLLIRRAPQGRLGWALFTLGMFRFGWFDLLVLNPAWVPQQVGALPLLNAAVLHALATAALAWTLPPGRRTRALACLVSLAAAAATIRQATHGGILIGPVGTGENWGYSAAGLALAGLWLWRGIATSARDLRVAGLALLTAVTFKVFLIDAAVLDGLLRILSFLGLGVALIAIGWAYQRFLGRSAAA